MVVKALPQDPKRLPSNSPLFLFKILIASKSRAPRQQLSLIRAWLHALHNGQAPPQLFLPRVKSLFHSKLNNKSAACTLCWDRAFPAERLTFTYVTLQPWRGGISSTATAPLQLKDADGTTPAPSRAVHVQRPYHRGIFVTLRIHCLS